MISLTGNREDSTVHSATMDAVEAVPSTRQTDMRKGHRGLSNISGRQLGK